MNIQKDKIMSNIYYYYYSYCINWNSGTIGTLILGNNTFIIKNICFMYDTNYI